MYCADYITSMTLPPEIMLKSVWTINNRELADITVGEPGHKKDLYSLLTRTINGDLQ